MNIAALAHEGLVNYNREVKEGKFPTSNHCTYKIPEGEMDKLQELLEKVSQASGVDVNDLAQMEGETTKLY